MSYLIVAAIASLLSLVGGGYLGYRYGSAVERKAAAVQLAAVALARAPLTK